MYWDSTFESWSGLGVSSQPTAILVDSKGERIDRWSGRLDTADVLAAVG